MYTHNRHRVFCWRPLEARRSQIVTGPPSLGTSPDVSQTIRMILEVASRGQKVPNHDTV